MTAPRIRPPAVDEGEHGSVAALLSDALAPSWRRLHSTLLVLVPMMAVLWIWETFRLPQPGIATFLLLMIVRADAMSTIGSSFAVACSVFAAALIAVVVLACSLSQPALRVPLMALMTFCMMMAVRGTTLGPVAFLVGFFATYGTTLADGIEGLARSTGDVVNVEGAGRPESDYFPPEEALVHALLWLGAAGVLPALLLAATERVAGADPRRMLLQRLRARTDAVAGYCNGETGAAARLETLGREGIAPLLDLMRMAERAWRSAPLRDVHLGLIRASHRLVLLMLAWDMAGPIETREDGATFLRTVGRFATALGRSLPGRLRTEPALPTPPSDASAAGLSGARPALATEISGAVSHLQEERTRLDRLGSNDAAVARDRPKPFWQADPFGAPNVRFALKVTLAVMLSYLIEIGLDWPGISSAVITCFVVALGTIGETVRKMILRILGSLVGAVLGIGTILLLMPAMTDFVQLALVFGLVAFASAWISFGTARISYAGWQILLAFSLTVLQGYGPTLDMQTGRDRIIGILIGNLVTAMVFLAVWPVRVGDAVRREIAGAFDRLVALMDLQDAGPSDLHGLHAAEAELRDRFAAGLARAGAVIPDDRFEPARPPLDRAGRLGRDAVARLGLLVVPVSVLATDRLDPGLLHDIPDPIRAELRASHDALRTRFAHAAAWIRTGAFRDRLTDPLPACTAIAAAPRLPDRVRARAALHEMAARQIAAFLDAALPEAVRVAAGPHATSRALAAR